jgi:4-amino-4-deoxy-L-arabinose transferase-like glycosyltransferase
VRALRERFSLVLALLTAAFLRLYGLNNLSPPGLAHDEVAHWLINRDILAGRHAVYFTEAYGHEAGFHYLQTLFMALLGDHALALRLPAAFCGLLLVAVSFALARRLFGWRVALGAAVLLAILFYPVFYSRQGLRAISLPLLSGLSAYFWWQGWVNGRRNIFLPSLLAGLSAGLSFHTYMAARAVPIFYALFVVYLALFHRPALRAQWRQVALFWLVYALVAAPLAVYLLANPGAEHRISEVDAPLRALLAGDGRPMIENALKIAGMFGLRGDPLWRQNVAGAPVFTPALAALFYLGVWLSVWRWRDGRYAFLLLWLLTATIPSLVTIDAPSSIRIINVLPILSFFPILLIHHLAQLSPTTPKLSTAFTHSLRVGALLVGLALLHQLLWTVTATFRIWPQNDEVQFVWQTALTAAVDYLDHSPHSGPVTITGWSPDTMDPPTMALSLRHNDVNLRYSGANTLIAPAGREGEAARLLRPTILPLAPQLEARLRGWGAGPQAMGHFTLYTLPAPLPVAPQVSADILLGGELRFLGYDAPEPDSLLTYWQVVAPATGARRFFLHRVDQAGNILAQQDSLDAPAIYWQPGDVIVQHHLLPATAESGRLHLGVYDPDTCPVCQRLLTGEGTDMVQLPGGE